MEFGKAGKTAKELVTGIELVGSRCRTEKEELVLAVQDGVSFSRDGAVDCEDGGIEAWDPVAAADLAPFQETIVGLSVEQQAVNLKAEFGRERLESRPGCCVGRRRRGVGHRAASVDAL